MAWRRPRNAREWMQIIFRHKKKFFFPAVSVMIAVTLASWSIPREYTAQAEFRRFNDAALAQMPVTTIRNHLAPIRRALLDDLKGKQAIEQLVDDLKLTRDLEHTADGELTKSGQLRRQQLVRQLEDSIRVRFRIQSEREDRIQVIYTDSNPERASQVVNQLVENYIRSTRQELDSMILNAQTFFEREVNRYRHRSLELESRKLKFEMQYPNMEPDDPASVQSRLVELNERQKEVAQELRVKTGELEALIAWIEEQPEQIETTQEEMIPELADLRKQHADAMRELDFHLIRMNRTEVHPEVIKTRRLISRLDERMAGYESQVQSLTTLSPNEQRIAAIRTAKEMEGQIAGLRGQHEDLVAEVETYEVLNRNFFVTRNEYRQMTRDLMEANKQLSFWEDNLRQTTLALSAEVGQQGVRMAVTNRAPLLAKPSKPDFFTIMAGAVAAGLGVGVALLVVAELLDHSFRSVDQAVDELKLPVLGAVNEIALPGQNFKRRLVGMMIYPPIALAMLAVLAGVLWLAFLSLEHPDRYEDLMRRPGERLPFLSQR